MRPVALVNDGDAIVSRRAKEGDILKFVVHEGRCLLCQNGNLNEPVLLMPDDKVALQNQSSDTMNMYRLDGVDEAVIVFVGGQGLSMRFPDHPRCKPVSIRDLCDESATVHVLSICDEERLDEAVSSDLAIDVGC